MYFTPVHKIARSVSMLEELEEPEEEGEEEEQRFLPIVPLLFIWRGIGTWELSISIN